jgi:HAD superfamily hydrolase (TIGR01484 family)
MPPLPYQLLVLDLDGTAITRDGRVTDGDRAAAVRLRALGVDVTIATGRLWPGTSFAARALGINAGVAVMNGSEHVHAGTGQTTQRWSVDATSRGHLRAVFDSHRLEPFLFASGVIHHDRRANHHAPLLRIWAPTLQAHDDLAVSTHWDGSDDVLSVCALGDRAQIDAARVILTPLLHDDLGFVEFDVPGGQRFLEVRHRHEDKATALRRLAVDRGLSADQVVAVGDWQNDVTMLRAAGLGLAMTGASQDAVDAADEVLPALRGQGGAVAAAAMRVWGV